MKNIQYKFEDVSANLIDEEDRVFLQDTLNEYGNNGFELVSVVAFENKAKMTMHRLYFKKEK